MKLLVRSVATFLAGSIFFGQCLGFGTGSHFDLTRTVLAEHGFRETPIKIVQVENWLTDYYSSSPTLGDDHRAVLKKLHFDNLFDDAQVRAYWATLIRNLRHSTEKAAFNDDRFSTLVVLGMGLHAVQDFYSHSNWVELHPPRSDGSLRAETFWTSMTEPGVSVKGLRTGKYPDDRKSGPGPFPVPAVAESHGGNDNGLNKDSPIRPRWDEAFVFAYVASHELVNAMESWAEKVRPGFWRSVCEYAIEASDEKRLNADVTAARNISMWLKGEGQDGTWKGEGSGSSRFFTKFSGNWVTEDSSVFVKAIRDGKIQDEMAADLYTRTDVADIGDVERLSLKRTAVMIKVTHVAESRDGNSLRKKLTSSLGGSDFYSRITVGGQEFWGRTIQKSRAASDPWYEIFIVDDQTTEIPITISVWDEDHTDAAKDQHIDLNPTGGVLDLRFVFNASGGSLSGDINGIFDSKDKLFVSEGRKPDERRAVIRGFVAKRAIR
jgi:hypothetical protein